MKKSYFFVLVAATAIGGLAFTKMSKSNIALGKYVYNNSHKNSAGPPSGRSGAPGESNCTECHSGSVQDGTGINQLVLLDANSTPVTEYTPGATYTVAISTETAAKRGFQVSPRILSNNTKAGNSVGITGSSSLQSANNQHYINHNATSNTASAGWAFTWTAPSTDVGDVCFYLVTNKTNSNSASSGDVIRTSQHTFSAAASTADVKEATKGSAFSVAFNAVSNTLKLDFNAKESNGFYINLVDMSGKSVLYKKLNDVKIGDNSQNVILPEDLNAGIYVVNFFENNNSSSKKIYIAK